MISHRTVADADLPRHLRVAEAEPVPAFVIAGDWDRADGRPHPYGRHYRARLVEGRAVYFRDAEASFSPAVEAEVKAALRAAGEARVAALEALHAAHAALQRAAFASSPPPAGWTTLENVR